MGREVSEENGISDERLLDALSEGIASEEDRRQLHWSYYRHNHYNHYHPVKPVNVAGEASKAANITTKTFNKGKNRRAGFYTRYATDYKLASSIIVTRAGERDPGVGGFDVVAADPDFATTDKSLQPKGVTTMNAVGAGIKTNWAVA
jgi:hypothetical protein